MTFFLALMVSLDDFWIWALVGAAGGLVLFYRGFRLLQRKRLILNTPTSKIRSASLGLVEVNGLAVGPYTMHAPITANTCFYCRTKAWEYRQSGKNKEWRLVADEGLHVPFFLDDNTGKLLINPDGAEMDIHRDFQEEYSNSILFGNEMPHNVRAFLMRHGVSGDHKIKIEEYCIKPKNALFILGTLAENNGPSLTSNPVPTRSAPTASFTMKVPTGLAGTLSNAIERIPGSTVTRTITVTTRTNMGPPHQEVIQLSSGKTPDSSADRAQQGKIAAALIKAGIGNPAAWAAAGIADPGAAAAASSVATLAPPETGNGAPPAPSTEGFDLEPKVVLMKGGNTATFLISWRSERAVVQRMSWKSTAYIWCGPALTLLSVYVLLAHFGML